MKLKCQKCKYEWNTGSKLLMVSCPSCGTKVKVPRVNIKERKNEN